MVNNNVYASSQQFLPSARWVFPDYIDPSKTTPPPTPPDPGTVTYLITIICIIINLMK